jgi:hypothetical protein
LSTTANAVSAIMTGMASLAPASDADTLSPRLVPVLGRLVNKINYLRELSVQASKLALEAFRLFSLENCSGVNHMYLV